MPVRKRISRQGHTWQDGHVETCCFEELAKFVLMCDHGAGGN